MQIQRGFSLVELIVIITIISVLAITATARFGGREGYDALGFRDELVNAFRYARQYAVASGCLVQVNVAASAYSVNAASACDSGAYNVALNKPGAGGAFTGSAPGGITVTGGTGNYVFDAVGSVSAGGTIVVSSGGSSQAFSVVAATGFVDLP